MSSISKGKVNEINEGTAEGCRDVESSPSGVVNGDHMGRNAIIRVSPLIHAVDRLSITEIFSLGFGIKFPKIEKLSILAKY